MTKIDNNLNVCFITDSNYLMPVTIAITSLKENRDKNTILNIFIIAVNIKNQELEILKSLKSENFNINIIHSENVYANLNSEHKHVSKAALLKFNIADILSEYNKVLYLDSDIIVKKDLTKLYETDINNVYAAVIRDMKCEITHKDHIRIENEFYFNSGVMLLNLEKIRKDNLKSKFIAEKEKEIGNNIIRYQDQDVFNKVFKNNVKYLDCNYNLLNAYLKYYSKDEIKNFYGISKIDEYVLHIASYEKPWKYKNIICGNDWFKYYKLSPYKNIRLKLKKNNTLSVLETIFSITNDYNKKHKVLTVMGIKIKFKSKK